MARAPSPRFLPPRFAALGKFPHVADKGGRGFGFQGRRRTSRRPSRRGSHEGRHGDRHGDRHGEAVTEPKAWLKAEGQLRYWTADDRDAETMLPRRAVPHGQWWSAAFRRPASRIYYHRNRCRWSRSPQWGPSSPTRDHLVPVCSGSNGDEESGNSWACAACGRASKSYRSAFL